MLAAKPLSTIWIIPTRSNPTNNLLQNKRTKNILLLLRMIRKIVNMHSHLGYRDSTIIITPIRILWESLIIKEIPRPYMETAILHIKKKEETRTVQEVFRKVGTRTRLIRAHPNWFSLSKGMLLRKDFKNYLTKLLAQQWRTRLT